MIGDFFRKLWFGHSKCAGWKCKSCGAECTSMYDLVCTRPIGSPEGTACPLEPVDVNGDIMRYEDWKKQR